MLEARLFRFGPRRSLPLLLLMGILGCASAPLTNPSPIRSAGTPALTRAAILRAVVYSHWSLESQKPGEVVARLARGGWDMVVRIDYGDEVSIHYVSSDNLNYDGSADPPTIHHGYNVRVKRLMDAIEREVILADASSQ